MKKLFILFCAAASAMAFPAAAQTFSTGTYNVRQLNAGDDAKGNGWQRRLPVIASLVRFHDFDIFGAQEVFHSQLEDLLGALPGYGYTGVGRDDGAEAGEYSVVFYKRDRFELLDSGVFWLSEEPETPGSKGWDGACERLATWTVLRDKSGRELLFINTHLDHVGEQARREGVALLLRRIETLRDGRPVILTGDFNAEPSSSVIAHVVADGTLRSAWDTAPERHGTAWSFSDFGQLPEEERPLIDYVFCGGGLEVRSCSILPDTLGGGYLSDHAPVEARLKYVR